ncbi:MAG TPA: class II aldolase/adducin family protein [Phycisphaerae bacterium]|nr:class II aldolase/adducin family protein [Phycisphaerae bacterium]HNU44958.1 class II aldolase/adducin family protein [Phycisphaerae bacterium]
MSEELQVRQELCEVGRRLYARGFAAGNDGNLSYRLSDDIVVCTPTLMCKGFMQPTDLCLVDMAGKQVFGPRKHTSEIHLHLEVYRSDPAVRAVVHCHPPHATAFAVAREDIPSGILPEVEVFLGIVPRAEYETPGGSAFAEKIRPFLGRANTVVLSNHGVVSWANTLELAYWRAEMLDAYCRILILAKLVGNVERLPDDKVMELMNLKQAFGMGADPRQQQSASLLVNPTFGKRSKS